MTSTRIAFAASLVWLVATSAGCEGKSNAGGGAPAPQATTAAAAPEATSESAGNACVGLAEARTMFNTRCATCHGTEGKGNGPGAVALNPKPRNYHDKAWQAKVTDDDIRKTITYGGAAVGKSPIMPASPDLDSKPQVVDGLVKIVRDFGKD
jgi:hypothetical protein